MCRMTRPDGEQMRFAQFKGVINFTTHHPAVALATVLLGAIIRRYFMGKFSYLYHTIGCLVQLLLSQTGLTISQTVKY